MKNNPINVITKCIFYVLFQITYKLTGSIQIGLIIDEKLISGK